MKKEIILPNRDKIGTKFVQLKDNEYILQQEGEFPFRLIGTKENIKAIDPCGGPFISVGYVIDNYIVEEINYNKEKGYIFKLKENE